MSDSECRCEYLSEESGGQPCVCQACHDVVMAERDKYRKAVEWALRSNEIYLSRGNENKLATMAGLKWDGKKWVEEKT